MIKLSRFSQLLAIGLALCFSCAAHAQSSTSAPDKNPGIVGTWRMTAVYSWTEQDKDHVNKQAYGPHPDGLITYTADRRMTRYVKIIDANHISLRTPPVMRNGVAEIHEMFWERVK